MARYTVRLSRNGETSYTNPTLREATASGLARMYREGDCLGRVFEALVMTTADALAEMAGHGIELPTDRAWRA